MNSPTLSAASPRGRLGQQLPEVNVVVTMVVVAMFVPILIAARLTGGDNLAPGVGPTTNA